MKTIIDLQKTQLLAELCEHAIKDKDGAAKFLYNGQPFAVIKLSQEKNIKDLRNAGIA